jgi:hypothetical protein
VCECDIYETLTITDDNVKLRNFHVTGNLTIIGNNIDINNITVTGSLIIIGTDIRFTNSTIGGDVTIEQEDPDGEFRLHGVKANNIFIKSGGSNSVIILDSQVGGIEIDKPQDAGEETVSLKLEGDTTTGNITVKSAANILNNSTGSVGSVELTRDIPADAEVTMSGEFDSVTLRAALITVTLEEDMSIGTMRVHTGYTSKITGTKAIENYIVFGDIDADGKIDSADVTLLRRYIAAEDKGDFGNINLANAKVSGRNSITAEDITMLRRYIAAGGKAAMVLGGQG